MNALFLLEVYGAIFVFNIPVVLYFVMLVGNTV